MLSAQNVSLMLNRKNLSFQSALVPCYFCAEGVTTISPYGQSSSLIEIGQAESFVFLTGIRLPVSFGLSFGFVAGTLISE